MNEQIKVEPVVARNQAYIRKDPPPLVKPTDSIKTTRILHFTIGVRDHISAATFYSEVLGCKHLRSNSRYSFMECCGCYFVLAKMADHVNPNKPDEEAQFSWAPRLFP